jgi:hypothetical protein
MSSLYLNRLVGKLPGPGGNGQQHWSSTTVRNPHSTAHDTGAPKCAKATSFACLTSRFRLLLLQSVCCCILALISKQGNRVCLGHSPAAEPTRNPFSKHSSTTPEDTWQCVDQSVRHATVPVAVRLASHLCKATDQQDTPQAQHTRPLQREACTHMTLFSLPADRQTSRQLTMQAPNCAPCHCPKKGFLTLCHYLLALADPVLP